MLKVMLTPSLKRVAFRWDQSHSLLMLCAVISSCFDRAKAFHWLSKPRGRRPHELLQNCFVSKSTSAGRASVVATITTGGAICCFCLDLNCLQLMFSCDVLNVVTLRAGFAVFFPPPSVLCCPVAVPFHWLSASEMGKGSEREREMMREIEREAVLFNSLCLTGLIHWRAWRARERAREEGKERETEGGGDGEETVAGSPTNHNADEGIWAGLEDSGGSARRDEFTVSACLSFSLHLLVSVCIFGHQPFLSKDHQKYTNQSPEREL